MKSAIYNSEFKHDATQIFITSNAQLYFPDTNIISEISRNNVKYSSNAINISASTRAREFPTDLNP